MPCSGGGPRVSVYRHRQAPPAAPGRGAVSFTSRLGPGRALPGAGNPARRPVRRLGPGRRLRHPAGGRPLPVLGAHHAMYRLLHAAGRRGTGTPPQTPPPSGQAARLVATALKQAWTWDIPCLAGPRRGGTYPPYVVLDLSSRYSSTSRMASEAPWTVGPAGVSRETSEASGSICRGSAERPPSWLDTPRCASEERPAARRRSRARLRSAP